MHFNFPLGFISHCTAFLPWFYFLPYFCCYHFLFVYSFSSTHHCTIKNAQTQFFYNTQFVVHQILYIQTHINTEKKIIFREICLKKRRLFYYRYPFVLARVKKKNTLNFFISLFDLVCIQNSTLSLIFRVYCITMR